MYVYACAFQLQSKYYKNKKKIKFKIGQNLPSRFKNINNNNMLQNFIKTYHTKDCLLGRYKQIYCLKLFIGIINKIMSEARKNQIFEEFRRPSGNKSSKSRDLKARLHHFRSKQTFLTDTQTSDYTKSSGQINASRIEHLQQTIRKLQKQNAELKQRVLDLKASQCFQINEDKLKNMIRQSDQLRNEADRLRKELEQSLVQRDFLQRFNKNLKAQCETLTKQILTLKSASSMVQSKRIQKNIYTSRDEGQNSRSRNSSMQMSKSSKKKQFLNWKKEKDQKQKEKEKSVTNILKSSMSSSGLHQDYYGGRSNRQKLYKHH